MTEGASQPSSGGPRRIPATISPTTRGWCSLANSQPSARATEQTTTICKSRVLSSGTNFQTSAGDADESPNVLRRSPDARGGGGRLQLRPLVFLLLMSLSHKRLFIRSMLRKTLKKTKTKMTRDIRSTQGFDTGPSLD